MLPARTTRWIALLFAATITSNAVARDAVVGRESSTTIRERVVILVNDARSQARRCGRKWYRPAPPLTVSGKLSQAAFEHARNMARKQFFDHRGADGSQPRDRVVRAGYEPRLTGENIAFGPESAEEVVAGWLASPGHCENIMDARFQHIGVALASGRKRGSIYWVQAFGAPRSSRQR